MRVSGLNGLPVLLCSQFHHFQWGRVFNAQVLIQGGPLLYSQVRQKLISGEAGAEVSLPQVKGTYKP